MRKIFELNKHKAARCRNNNLAWRAKLDGFRRKAARRVEAMDGRNHNGKGRDHGKYAR